MDNNNLYDRVQDKIQDKVQDVKDTAKDVKNTVKEKKDEIVDKFSGSGNHSQQNNWKQDTQHDKQNDWNQNIPYDKDNHEKNTSKTAGQYGNQSGAQNFNKPPDNETSRT